jgi:hypothetical protein
MYKFHYSHMRVWYPSCELLFTDTDSLVYQIFTDDLYADLASRRAHFDFSGYPETHSLYGCENKMVMGKMKDESGGDIITEFVGLRPKMYSYTTLVAPGSGVKEAKRAKGIQRSAVADLRHSDYLAQIQSPHENYVNIQRIGQKHHRIYTMASQKRGLCAFDDKRFLLPDGVHTLAHGHVRIREQQQQQQQQQSMSDGDNELVRTDSATASRTIVVADENELDSENAVILTAAQSRQLNIRTHTRREALDSLAGTDLRRELTHASARVGTSRVNGKPPTAKRARVVDESDEDDADCADDSMRLVDEAAQFVALNGEF